MPEKIPEIKKDSSESFQQNQPPIQQVLIIIEHKIRNLEKRKGKLDAYKEILKSGQDLNLDQEVALEKYDEVIHSLDLSRDFCKQFQIIANVANKEGKREARRNAYLKQQNEISKVREVLIIQDTLSHLKSDDVRQDFLAGTNCATKIDANDMNLLEKFFIEVTPTRPLRSDEPSFVTSAQNAADVFSNVIDAKPKEFLTSTYTHVRDVLQTIQGCGYFDKDIVTVAEKAAVEEPKEEGDDLESETLSERGSSGLNDCGDNDEEQKMGAEGIPEMTAVNQREQTPIEVQQVTANVMISNSVATNHTPKDFGETPTKCAPSAKNVPVPMFKCSPTQQQQQMIINQQHSIQQQLISVPAAIAPNMVTNLAPGIVPQPIAALPMGVVPTPNPHIAATTVRAVEQAYFKQHQYIHHQPQQPQQMRPQPPIHEVIGSANFFFLQESELDSPDMPTPAPGFPSQHIQLQTTVKQNQPSPSLTHNHNNVQPPLPTVNNLHHPNSSPIPLQQQQQQPLQPPPHLQQLQQNPGIPTQTFTNQTFSNVAPQQLKQPQQQMFTPPGLNVNGANNSATFNSSAANNHKPQSTVDLSQQLQQPHITGFQSAAAVAVAVTVQPHQPKSLQQSVSAISQQQTPNNMLATAPMNSTSSVVVGSTGYNNSPISTTNSSIPGFSTNNIQPFSSASQNIITQQQQQQLLQHQTTTSHFQATQPQLQTSQPQLTASHQNSNTSSSLQQQQHLPAAGGQQHLQKHNEEQNLTEKLKSSLNINERKPQPSSTQDHHLNNPTDSNNDDVKDWNLMNSHGGNDHQNNNDNNAGHWNSDDANYSRYGRRSGGNGVSSRGGSGRDGVASSGGNNIGGGSGGGGYRGRANNYQNGNNNYSYGNNSRQSSDVGNNGNNGNSGNTTFFRNNDRYQNQSQNGGGYNSKTDYARSNSSGGGGGAGTGTGYKSSRGGGVPEVGGNAGRVASTGMNNGQDYRSSRPTSGGGGGNGLRGANSYRGSTNPRSQQAL